MNCVVVVRAFQRRLQVDDQLVIERVPLVRAVQRQECDPVSHFEQNCLRRRHLSRFSPSRAASSPSTSISIRSNAVENVLPCASVINESVPPPPRLSCRRKLSALRLGSSNRSTSPLQIPRKCSLTRAAVTSRTSRG